MPYDYKVSDTFQWYMLVKSIGQNGWFWENTQMAAPFGFTAYDYTAYFLLNIDLFKNETLYNVFNTFKQILKSNIKILKSNLFVFQFLI